MGLISRWLGIDRMLSMHESVLQEVLRTSQIQAEAARIQAEAALAMTKHMWELPVEPPDQWVSTPDLPFDPRHE